MIRQRFRDLVEIIPPEKLDGGVQRDEAGRLDPRMGGSDPLRWISPETKAESSRTAAAAAPGAGGGVRRAAAGARTPAAASGRWRAAAEARRRRGSWAAPAALGGARG